jgi:hypothetical protein
MAGAIYDVRYIDYCKFSVNSRDRAWLTNLAEERPMVTSRRRVFTSQNVVLMKRMAEQGCSALLEQSVTTHYVDGLFLSININRPMFCYLAKVRRLGSKLLPG